MKNQKNTNREKGYSQSGDLKLRKHKVMIKIIKNVKFPNIQFLLA